MKLSKREPLAHQMPRNSSHPQRRSSKVCSSLSNLNHNSLLLSLSLTETEKPDDSEKSTEEEETPSRALSPTVVSRSGRKVARRRAYSPPPPKRSSNGASCGRQSVPPARRARMLDRSVQKNDVRQKIEVRSKRGRFLHDDDTSESSDGEWDLVDESTQMSD